MYTLSAAPTARQRISQLKMSVVSHYHNIHNITRFSLNHCLISHLNHTSTLCIRLHESKS